MWFLRFLSFGLGLLAVVCLLLVVWAGWLYWNGEVARATFWLIIALFGRFECGTWNAAIDTGLAAAR